MNTVGDVGTLSTRSLVRDGADFCEELVRRGGRALSIPFGNRRMIVSFRWMPEERRRSEPQIMPEFTDHELVSMASRYGASYEAAWERSLTLQYGGIRRH